MREARRTGGHGEDNVVDPLVGWLEARQEQDQTRRYKQIDDGPHSFPKEPQSGSGNDKAKPGGNIRFFHRIGLSSVWRRGSQRGRIPDRETRENRVPSSRVCHRSVWDLRIRIGQFTPYGKTASLRREGDHRDRRQIASIAAVQSDS